MTCPHCTPADPNDCIPCAIRGQDKEAVRGDLASAGVEIDRLQGEIAVLREERRIAWVETTRARNAIHDAFPNVQCDGVDLPGVVGAEVERLRAENTRARDALYDAICAVSNGKLCMQGAYNVHAPQISTERVARWRAALKEDTP